MHMHDCSGAVTDPPGVLARCHWFTTADTWPCIRHFVLNESNPQDCRALVTVTVTVYD